MGAQMTNLKWILRQIGAYSVGGKSLYFISA